MSTFQLTPLSRIRGLEELSVEARPKMEALYPDVPEAIRDALWDYAYEAGTCDCDKEDCSICEDMPFFGYVEGIYMRVASIVEAAVKAALRDKEKAR